MVFVDLLKDKRLYHVTDRLREEVISLIKRELSREDRILLVILFGGFIEREYTRDIDVAIYLRDPQDLLEDYRYIEGLQKRLSEEIQLPIDIVVLNHAPDSLFNTILINGRPIVIKDQRLYYGLRLLALDQRNYFYKLFFKHRE